MKALLILLFSALTTVAISQVETTSGLFMQMKRLDSILFEEGFNNCNLKDLETVLAEDLEFYHDVGGTQDKKEFLEAMAKNICGNHSLKITRELIEGSLEVFPLKNNDSLYGALVNGAHEFFRKESGGEIEKTGYARFTSYYELLNNVWKLKRVFSFDHKAAE